MAISGPDVKVLWARSGNRCAICFRELTEKGTRTFPVGQQAHIKGEHSGKGNKKQSARYDPSQTEDERNGYENIILICPDCHTIIDKDETKYTVDRLLSIKAQHERKVEDAIRTGTLNVTYYELEHTLRHLVQTTNEPTESDLRLIPPGDKIAKNKLGAQVERMIQAGLTGSRQVEEFLNQNADMDYSDKLRRAFVSNYEELKREGLEGDRLFYALLNVASNYNSDTSYMAAGLNVLVYYFQLCEVFEK